MGILDSKTFKSKFEMVVRALLTKDGMRARMPDKRERKGGQADDPADG